MSRYIDALVAEHVMGFEPDSYQDKFKSSVGWFSIDDWRPSTDISAAWEVVERFNRSTEAVSFKVHLVVDGTWYAATKGWGTSPYSLEDAHADTAPMAICKAALKVKGVSVEW